ncbi:MAG: Asp-tRNA(Asn)/Glu-tRNA(Gln) amidotransferase subunit GatA [Candidatus Nezhaarchaeales archaeon]
MERLENLTAKEIARRVRDGDISAQEVLHYFYERIERIDGRINAFITVTKELALQMASQVDAKVRRGEDPGRLAGVPVAVKDNICVAYVRATCASRILENYVPPYDATVITRLKREGAVIIGKTNMDEFAMGSSTETSAFGPTRNPWDLERVPGGSSGGSAAALACAMSPLALGSDTGGSIRCPASFCGVVGLKPTYGSVSRYGLIAYACSLEQIGPMARTVDDCALLFSVIAGRDEHDSTSIPVEASFNIEGGLDLQGLRLAIPKELVGEGTHEGVAKTFFKAVEAFERGGATIEEVSMPSVNYALPAYYLIAVSEASSNLARYDGVRYGFSFKGDGNWSVLYAKTRAKGFGAEVKRRIILGSFALSAGYYNRYYLKALKVRTLVKRDFERVLKKYDALLAPTMPMPPFKIGERIKDPLSMYMVDVDTVPMNLAGVPALSIPCGFTEGLPVGLQIIGRFFGEELIFKLGAYFERETGLRMLKPQTW